MAYNRVGGPGNDTLDERPSSGPGTIIGGDGNDRIFTGSGHASVNGGSGNDTITLQAGNTGTVEGGSGNDEIGGAGAQVGPMVHFAGPGADTINFISSSIGQTIVGGQDSSDAADDITTSTGDDLVWGNGGNDTFFEVGGNDTLVGGFGNDCMIQVGVSNDFVFLNQGDDFLLDGFGGTDTIFGGLGNDCILHGGSPLVFLNEGSDSFLFAGLSTGGLTVVGGQDAADGGDYIHAGFGSDVIYGEGGNDTIGGSFGNDTATGGAGADIYFFAPDSGRDEIFGFNHGEGDRLDFSGQTYSVGTSSDGELLLVLSGGGTVELNGIAPGGFSPGFVL